MWLLVVGEVFVYSLAAEPPRHATDGSSPFADKLSRLLVKGGPGLLIVVPKRPSSSVASEAAMRTDAPNREKRDGASTCSRRVHGPTHFSLPSTPLSQTPRRSAWMPRP